MTATAQLTIAQVAGRSVVAGARPAGPLRLLAPSGGGDAAWVYQASLGGGLIGADDLALDIEVEAGATLFLSSQASSKVFRTARSRTAIRARVDRGGTLIAWPDPVVCFAGAALDQRQAFALAADASLVCVDAIAAGRVARGERWAFDRLATRLTVDIGDERALSEAMLLAPEHGAIAARMGGAGAIATIVVAGPRVASIAAAILDAAAGPLPRTIDDALITASPQPWGAIARIAAPTVEALLAVIAAHLRAPVAALLGDDPWARRW
ncbi:MAG: urease accessory protein UreD [Deltaproteobacteria bacterium]|nr:urease accessory protein UreD [Deltaproteobacteria bacterium]